MPKNSRYIQAQFLFFSLLFSVSLHSQGSGVPLKGSVIVFTKNQGQVHDQHYAPRPDVLFSGITGNTLFHLRNSGISYQFTRTDSWKKEDAIVRSIRKGKSTDRRMPDRSRVYRLDVNWPGCNNECKIESSGELPGYGNYYLSHCPDGVLGVSSYNEIYYRQIYAGIDLHYYEKDGTLKYDYIVAPGADYQLIRMQVKGANEIRIGAKGELIISTPLGTITEDAPLVFQKGKQLKGRWNVNEDIISFQIFNVDPHSEMVIDPAIRAWGTYYGGGGGDYGYGVATDAAGNVYMTGNTTQSSTLIATSGAHQTNFGGAASTQWRCIPCEVQCSRCETVGNLLWRKFRRDWNIMRHLHYG
jgi:hypothetical protein